MGCTLVLVLDLDAGHQRKAVYEEPGAIAAVDVARRVFDAAHQRHRPVDHDPVIGNPNLDTALMLGWMELLFTGVGLVVTVATLVWLRPTWGVWMAGNWLLIVSTGFVMSVPRYSLALFGIMVWGAIIADRWRVAGWVIAAGSATAMAYFTWRFGSGQWAF